MSEKVFEIRPVRIVTAEGVTVTPEDSLATICINCELSARKVLSLLQFRHCELVEVADDEIGEIELGELDTTVLLNEPLPNGPLPNNQTDKVEPPFAGYSSKVQAALASEGIVTLAQAALYASQHDGSLEPIDGIGPKINAQLLEQIKAAGFPT